MARTVLAAAVAIATVSALDTNGAFSEIQAGDAETQLLTKALADDSLYGKDLKTRACFVEITGLGNQVVSGTKYKFHVTGCETSTGKAGGGKCAGEYASCKAEPLEIMVFDQPWTETVIVLSITKDAASGSNDGNAASNGTDATGSATSDEPVALGASAAGSGSSSDDVIIYPSKTPTTTTPAPTSKMPRPTPTSSAAAVQTGIVAALVAVAAALV